MEFEVLLAQLITFLAGLGGKIFATALVLLIGLKLSGIVVKIMTKSHVFQSIDVTVQTFLKSAVSIVLKAVVFVTAIGILGVPLTSVVTVIASCGVAVGLALQGGLSNIAGGIIILIFKPFKVGDYIDDKSVNGTVEAIGIFYTTLITPDNKRVIIPNGGLMNSTIIAANQLDTRRVDFEFSVAYSEDLDNVRKVLSETVLSNNDVLKEKDVDIFVSKHDESSVKFSVRAWTKTENYWTVFFDINEKVKKAFDENKIQIPFPQMDVHVKQN